MAVDDVVVTIFFGRCAHPNWVGAGVFRFGHGEAASDLAVCQWLEETFLLFGRAMRVQNFHIADIGRLTVEGVVAEGRTAEGFADVGKFEQG